MKRNKTFYILCPSAMLGSVSNEVFWSNNPNLVTRLIQQNAHVEYDILEIEGDNSIEVFDKCLSEFNLAVDLTNQIELFYTNNGIEFLSSVEYISNVETQTVLDSIIEIILRSYLIIKILLPYVAEQYKTHLSIFLNLLQLYITRLILFNNMDVQELSFEQARNLKFLMLIDKDKLPNDVNSYCWKGEVDDIIDDMLLRYMIEFGW